MKVTIKFNVAMTFAFFGYAVIVSPVLLDNPTPLMVESFFPDNELLQFLTLLLSFVFSIVISMYIIRALWNRLFPNLCGWKEINLAECYAMSLFLAMFLAE